MSEMTERQLIEIERDDYTVANPVIADLIAEIRSLRKTASTYKRQRDDLRRRNGL